MNVDRCSLANLFRSKDVYMIWARIAKLVTAGALRAPSKESWVRIPLFAFTDTMVLVKKMLKNTV